MTGGAEALQEDHEARIQAALAHQRIDSHERHCAERWMQTRESVELLHGRVSDTNAKLDENHRRVVRWIIGGQGAVILVLLAAAVAAAGLA